MAHASEATVGSLQRTVNPSPSGIGGSIPSTVHLGLVKWYHDGLQNRSRGFDSRTPCHGNVAQLVERSVEAREVAGSNPAVGTSRPCRARVGGP